MTVGNPSDRYDHCIVFAGNVLQFVDMGHGSLGWRMPRFQTAVMLNSLE